MLVTGKFLIGRYIAGTSVTAALAAFLGMGMQTPQFGIAQEGSKSERTSAEQRNEQTSAEKAAQKKSEERNNAERQSQRGEQGEQMRQRSYLGIQVEAIQPGSMHNLPEPYLPGQGLRVLNVASGSPAEKAGIKSHNIVMCFDDQKLLAPQQLVGLVRDQKAGAEAELTILRNGKTQKIEVKVGEHEWNRESTASEANRNEQADHLSAEERRSENNANEREENSQSKNRSSGRSNGRSAIDESFDSLTMESTDKNLFKVQIQYLDENGKLEKHKFEGTLTELHEKIAAEKDLPPLERAQLIRSLELPVDVLAVPSVTFRTIPWSSDHDQSDGTF